MCNEAARLRSLWEISAAFSQLKIPLRFPDGLPNLGEAPSIRITDTTAIVRAAAGDPGGGIAPAAGGAAGDDGNGAPAAGAAAAADGNGAPAAGGAELVMRRWSWPGSGGRPVYNFRSEGRRFDAGRDSATGAPGTPYFGRCLIPLDAFFEFTDAGTVADAAGGADDAGSALSLPLHEQRAPPSPRRGEGAGPPAPSREGAAPRPAKARKDKWAFAAADGGLLCVAGLWRRGVVWPMGTDGAGVAPHGGEAFTMLTCAPGPDIAPYHNRQIVLMPQRRWADWLGVGERGVVPSAELIAPTPAGTLVVTRAR